MRITWRGSVIGQGNPHHSGAYLWKGIPPHIGHPAIRVTQLPVLTAIQGDTKIRVTQMPVLTAIQGTTKIRVTQVPILYIRQFLGVCTPKPPADITVHATTIQLTPRWKLERYDIKPRLEERRAGNPIGAKGDPTGSPDGRQWKLERFDIAATSQERA